MTKTIDQLIDELIGREGGYVNDPNDAGGETNFGITVGTARANGYTGAMKDLPRSTAADIYKRIYWTRPGFDRVAMIDADIAAELFDTGVNMGPAVAATFLQRALNLLNRGGKDYAEVAPDGKAGWQTIHALQSYRSARGLQGMRVLLTALQVQQGCKYLDLAEHRPANENFLFGWLLNRVAA